MDSGSAPPTAAASVVTTMPVSPAIEDGAVNVDAPLAAVLFVTTYFRVIILPSVIDLLKTPSPK